MLRLIGFPGVCLTGIRVIPGVWDGAGVAPFAFAASAPHFLQYTTSPICTALPAAISPSVQRALQLSQK